MYVSLWSVEQTINWVRFVSMVFDEVHIDIRDTEEVIVRHPDYIMELGRLLQNTSGRFVGLSPRQRACE